MNRLCFTIPRQTVLLHNIPRLALLNYQYFFPQFFFPLLSAIFITFLFRKEKNQVRANPTLFVSFVLLSFPLFDFKICSHDFWLASTTFSLALSSLCHPVLLQQVTDGNSYLLAMLHAPTRVYSLPPQFLSR